MTFTTDFITSPLIISLMAVALLCAIYLSTIYRARIALLRRHARSGHGLDAGSKVPPLSVIVYSKDCGDRLEQMLTDILEQDYPSGLEVIVATDGRSSSAEDTVNRLSANHRNLRMTFVPDDTRALSRKKLAITLGIKAARYDHVLLTDASVDAPSNLWLAEMAKHFATGKQVVIGIADLADESGRPERPIAAFDTLADTVTYISAAIYGHPYRGNDHNIAFTKQLFFDIKGFASSINLHHGIDDIFVSRIASPTNCSVELSGTARPTLRCSNLAERHLSDKQQHLFTGRMVSRSSRRFFGLGSLMMWFWLAATVATAIISWPDVIPAAVCLIAGIAWMAIVSVSWTRAGAIVGVRPAPALLPVLMMWRPIYNLTCRLRSLSHRSRNFTWSKG